MMMMMMMICDRAWSADSDPVMGKETTTTKTQFLRDVVTVALDQKQDQRKLYHIGECGSDCDSNDDASKVTWQRYICLFVCLP